MEPVKNHLFLRADLYLAALAALAFFWPEGAFGAEAGEVHHKEFSFAEEGFKFANTFIVVAILYKVAAKPIASFFKDRSEGIRKALDEAKADKEEAEKKLEQQRSKVADLEAELGRVRETGERERGEIRARLEADQKTQAERLLEQTKNAIELEVVKARAELQDRAAEIALELAEEMLKKNIGSEDQERFVSEYLVKLESEIGGGS
jgi:F-type H+-transporting ATPase subunit b